MEQNLFEGYTREKQQVVTRRRALALMGTGGSIAVASLLTGCSLFGGGSDTTASNSTTTAAAPTQAPAQAAPTQAPASSGATPQSGHTGTVIGATSQASNSAKTFNDMNNQNALLIHLPNGNFVAYDSACTHEGVTVNYDPGTQKLICPKHGAIFDPANGATVLSGPAPSALPKVAISVNGDGTITMS